MNSRDFLIGAALLLAVSAPAGATGLATCDSGPQSGWKPQEVLQQQLTQRGWQIRRIKIDGGCYEVYALDEQGKRVEAYFGNYILDSLAQKG